MEKEKVMVLVREGGRRLDEQRVIDCCLFLFLRSGFFFLSNFVAFPVLALLHLCSAVKAQGSAMVVAG